MTVACMPDEDSVVVTVADTGRGIPREFLPHIFDRFSQADSSITRQHGGLGLGLGIVRHLVELHHGTVEAESEGVGRGATFRVRLPRLTTYAPTRDAAPADEPLRGARLLLVEDDEATRESVTMVLEQAGASVRAASGARVALETLPDV